MLTDKLLQELPGILNWSLRGLDGLRSRGHFEMPQSSRDALQALEDLASPINAFLREWCKVGPNESANVKRLFDAYTKWCDLEGHHHSSNIVFGRNLRAVHPEIETRGKGRDRAYVGVSLNDYGREEHERLEYAHRSGGRFRE